MKNMNVKEMTTFSVNAHLKTSFFVVRCFFEMEEM